MKIMSEHELLELVLDLLDQGLDEIQLVDALEDDLFEYLNILESYHIHARNYEYDLKVTEAKVYAEDDPDRVIEILETIRIKDIQDFRSFVNDRMNLHK